MNDAFIISLVVIFALSTLTAGALAFFGIHLCNYLILFDCNNPARYYREINGVGQIQVCLRDRATRLTEEQVKVISKKYWNEKHVRLFFSPAK